ncbi:hypothetical protein A4A49_35812 [Nicotiana attenuata]|uniref:Carboxypeptidase A inhibitor-like domain-containing protein n=1 Tax=Nicotiana attenuata TaxID=49451 RepID=A0A1J6JUM1_NICAT|nr:hypothetical protein A4A49_35812 [Nicotiana attenuata]
MGKECAMIKFAFVFTILVTTITVNLSSSQKMQSMAMRNLAHNMLSVKQKLMPLNDFMTCGRTCRKKSDCSDGWLCYECIYTPATIIAPALYQCDL